MFSPTAKANTYADLIMITFLLSNLQTVNFLLNNRTTLLHTFKDYSHTIVSSALSAFVSFQTLSEAFTCSH